MNMGVLRFFHASGGQLVGKIKKRMLSDEAAAVRFSLTRSPLHAILIHDSALIRAVCCRIGRIAAV